MDVFKCIVSLQHGSTLNCRRAESPLVWLVEGVERWEASGHPQVSSLKFGVETSQIVLPPLASMSSDAIRNNCNGYMKTYDECSEKVFALLPVLGKKAVLDWCIKEG
ncbi:hypothetical protein TNCV_1365771 [Trichonephila clavipes]|nr:hypothetical protein TNCV_1365771 [Trichonephila clavipes]